MKTSVKTKHFVGFLATALALSAACGRTAERAVDMPRPLIKVMTFNIRYGAANDGANSWQFRRGLTAEAILAFQPDLLGMQEVLAFQAKHLRAQLPGYGFHGVGREDGREKGEFCPVMFRTDRFAKLGGGHFWLSETPSVPGSKSWDSSLPRMVSWVTLRDRRTGREFVYANTHFDHRGPKARLESARLIRRQAQKLWAGKPVILTGDFNAAEGSPPYATLVQDRNGEGPIWTDAYRVIHPERTPWEATHHGWRGVRKGTRIDWILYTPEWVALDAAIVHMNDQGRYPSDHYPVTAVLRSAR